LSGIATLTKKFTQKVSNYNVKIYDTRKTLPGLRYLEKYAVRMAGGFNHRMDLKSMFMVKDNHINILRKVFKNSDYDSLIAKMKKKYPCKDVEIEVENFMQFKKALKSYPDIIMLDNMKPDKILKCIKEKEKFSQQDEKVKKIILEASGGINIDNVKKTAATGVDRISIGSLTNSAVSLDFSMELS
jgi:nicotinate-nucleotide pyrophosphorylase (carboxylating)